MPLGLRSALDLTTPTSTFSTPEEFAAQSIRQEQEALAENSSFGRGLSRGLYNLPASLANVAGQVVEPFSTTAAQPMFDWASQQQAAAQGTRLATDITDTDQIKTLGDAGNYVGGMIGENAPNFLLTAPVGGGAGMALKGTGLGLGARTYLGQAAASMPQNMGEQVSRLRADPAVLAETSATDRLLNSAGHGVVGGALEGIGDALMLGRLAGAGKGVTNTLFKDGIGAASKSALGHVAKAIPEAALTEGIPEALQERSGQLFHERLNPNRDASKDAHDLKESFFGGWAAGGGHSVVGRAADVGWANGRDGVRAAGDALGRVGDSLQGAMDKLRAPKSLPPALKDSDDQSVYEWDKADDAERNSLGGKLAERMLDDPETPGYLRQKAGEFMERMQAGASDAWQSMTDGITTNDTYTGIKGGIERFAGAVKKTAKEVKFNSEADDATQAAYEVFNEHVSHWDKRFGDTEAKSKLFMAVQAGLESGLDKGLPWHEIIPAFGGDKAKAIAGVEAIRQEMVRHGTIKDYANFAAELDAAMEFGTKSNTDRAALLTKYSPHGRHFTSPDGSPNAKAREYSRTLSEGIAEYERKSEKDRKDFDAWAKSLLGANHDTVIEAFGGRKQEVQEGALEDTQTAGSQQTITETEYVKPRFIGQAAKRSMAKGGEGVTVKEHGGMWNLGHSNKETRESIRKNMAETKRALIADGNTVKILKPLEYAEVAGIAPGKIAQNLGTSVAMLKNHPARMMQVTREQQIGLRDAGDQMTNENIASLGTLSHNPQYDSKILSAEQAAGAKTALRKIGAEQRKALSALGFDNGVKLEDTPNGVKLHNNQNHGGNGRFTVEMKDGSKHVVSAQELIKVMRQRGQKGTALQHFTAGVAAIMNNENVAGVKVYDVWGREQVAAKGGTLGAFGAHFRLEPGLTLGKAARATQKAGATADRVDVAEQAVVKAERDLAEAIAKDEGVEAAEQALDDAREELASAGEEQAMYEGDTDRPGVVGEKLATTQNVTPTEHAGEKELNFNDDGSPKHPYGNNQKGAPAPAAKKGGTTLHLRSGIGRADFTPAMSKTLRLINKAQKLVSTRAATLDVSADYLARAAAAQRDGNQKARDALLLTAQHRLHAALVDEINTLKDAQIGTDQFGTTTPTITALTNLATIVSAKAAEYEASRDKTLEAAKGYEAFVEKKVSEEPPPQGTRTLDEQKASDAAKAAYEAKLNAKSSDTKASEASVESDTTGDANQFENTVDEAVAEAKQEATHGEKAFDAVVEAGRDLKEAFNTLAEAFKYGDLDKVELVASLRAALKNFKDAGGEVGEVMKQLVKQVQAAIKGYQDAGRLYKSKAVQAVFAEQPSTAVPPMEKRGDATSAKKDALHAKLVAREAARVAGQFATGTEYKTYKEGLSDLKGHEIIGYKDADTGLYVVAAMPTQLLNKSRKALLKAAAEMGMDAAAAEAVFRAGLAKNTGGIVSNAALFVTYDLADGNTNVLAAFDGTHAETFLNKKGLLERVPYEEDGEVGETNKLLKVGDKQMIAFLGEAAARIKAMSGKAVLDWNWTRGTGANKGRSNTARFNAEGSFATGGAVTQADMDAANEYLAKVLGPQVKATLVKDLGGNSASWERTTATPALEKGLIRLYRGEGPKNKKGGDWFSSNKTYAENHGDLSYVDVTPEELGKHFAQGHHFKQNAEYVFGQNATIAGRVKPLHTMSEAVIKIAISATTPQSKAHHEAMHEFFQRLLDANPEAAAVLQRAASSAAVVRQIEQFFHKDANYAAIKAALADPHERVAYMYQLWAAGKLSVGPKTDTWFGKVAAFFRKVSGMISDSQHAEALMGHFHNGEMSTQSDVARVLSNDPAARAAYLKRVADVGNPLYKAAREMLITAQNELLDSGNKALEGVGRQLSNETGAQDKGISFMSARVMKTNQMTDRMVNLLRAKDASGKMLDDKDIAAAVEGLQTGTVSNDPQIAALQAGVRKMLNEIYDYMTEKNAAGKPLLRVPKRKDYFPQAWNPVAVAENKPAFIALLVKDGGLTQAEATEVANTLVRNRGATPLSESEYRVGFTPFMAAANKRVLDFKMSPELVKFQRQDIAEILTTYIAHAVHRTEYARRFGVDGKGLRDSFKNAVGEAVGPEWAAAQAEAETVLAATIKALKAQHTTNGKLDFEAFHTAMVAAGYPYGETEVKSIATALTPDALKKYKAFEPQLHRAQRAVMAMEGTLGHDMANWARSAQSGIIVYENMRLLTMSLFSQVIDPLGVLVRGGTAEQAWSTFKRGAMGTWAAWKGTPMQDDMTKLAMQLGIIDAGNFLNSQGQAYSGIFMGDRAKWFNDRLFRFNGVEGFSQGTRVGALAAAISFIKVHSTDATRTAHSERYLKELGLTQADVTLDAKGNLDYHDKKIQEAIFRWVDGAILRPNASMRPSWASDPHYALLFHMKQFTYAFQKVLLERVAHEAKNGNTDPLFAMLVTFVPAMIAADFLRGLVTYGGQEPPWKRNWRAADYLAEGVQRAGLLGVPQLALDVGKWGPGELTGPFGEQVLRSAKNFERAHKKDMRLDEQAARTGSARDQQAADEYNGFMAGGMKNLRMAIPTGEGLKRALVDPVLTGA